MTRKRFPVGDLTASGYLALPARGRGPGVLVVHAWWGLTPFFREYCDRLAAEGLVAFAPDLYAGATAHTPADAQRLRRALNRPLAERQLVAALAYVRRRPETASPVMGLVGFSLGAQLALRLAARHPADLAAVVAYYGAAAGSFAKSQAAFLAHFAEADPYLTLTAQARLAQALEKAGRPYTPHLYANTGHWFCESNQPAYVPTAARLAWRRTVQFLKLHLPAPRATPRRR